MSKTKNDVAWEKLFEKHNILQEIKSYGYYRISSSSINAYRQARLMAKFDYSSQLPKVFTDNNLTILPVTRGEYMISHFQIFHEFNTSNLQIKKFPFPHYIKSIDYSNITSESTALNCAYTSGMLEDFLDDTKVKPTVSGRMGSKDFSFKIKNLNSTMQVDVKNSQIEIDGGYEGRRFLSLIEAKNVLSEDFLIRQIYYPFRLWENRIDKAIKNIFLTYSNGIFHFREYAFNDVNYYNSLKLVKEMKYVIADQKVCLDTIQDILSSVSIIDEPSNIPFPQADSFERIINLCESLNKEIELSKDDLTEKYAFTARQTDYYTNATRYLGLVKKCTDQKNETVYKLTDKGNRLFEIDIYTRQIEFIKRILAHYVFNMTLKHYFENNQNLPNKEKIVSFMRENNIEYSQDTLQRRAKTVLSWIEWILQQS
ncbi:MAG: type II restriction enzyme [Candidatus Zixiibacteriota bacterium]